MLLEWDVVVQIVIPKYIEHCPNLNSGMAFTYPIQSSMHFRMAIHTQNVFHRLNRLCKQYVKKSKTFPNQKLTSVDFCFSITFFVLIAGVA